jgi:RNA polymerase sigma-70 factor (ECF subfamily)
MEQSAMRLLNDSSTNPALLSEVADWRNHPAWVSFQARYDPLLRRWCLGHGLDADSVDEVCQRIWIELADRMRTFRYDPNRTFRGWLRRVCASRVVDFLRQRNAAVGRLGLVNRDDPRGPGARRRWIDSIPSDLGEGETDPFQLFLHGEAETVQAAVRQRIQPRTWDAFWLIAVCDWTVARTAKTLGMTHTAVFAARERVARMLCDEGKRRSERWPAVD